VLIGGILPLLGSKWPPTKQLVGACAGSSRNGELHGHSLTFGPPAVSAHAAFSSSREAPWHKHCARSRAHAAPTEVHRTCCASDAWSWCWWFWHGGQTMAS